MSGEPIGGEELLLYPPPSSQGKRARARGFFWLAVE